MAEDPIDIAKKGRELVERVAKENGINADIDSYIKGADGNYSRAIDDLLESNGHATYDDEVKKKIHSDYNVPVITPEYIKNNRLSDEERALVQKEYEGIQKALTEDKSRDINTGNWGGGFHATGLSTDQKKRYSQRLDDIDKRIEADQQLKDLMPNVTIIKPSTIGPRSLKSLKEEVSNIDNAPEFTAPSQFGGGMAMSNPFLPSAEGQQKKAKEKEAKALALENELEKEKTEEPYYIRAQTAIASSKQLGNDQKDADINSRYILTDHAAKLSRQLEMAIDDYKATGDAAAKERIDNVYAHLQEQAKEVAAGSSMAHGIEVYAQAKMAMVDAEASGQGSENKYLGRGALTLGANVFAKQAAKQFVLGWKNVAWSLDDMLNGKGKTYEQYLQDTKSRGEQEADAVLPAAYRGSPIDAYIEVDGQKFLVDGNGDIQTPIDNKFRNIELNSDIKSKIDKYEGNRDAYKVNSGILGGHISLTKLVGSNATVAFNMIPIIAASTALAMVPGGEGAALQYLAGIGTSSLMMFHDNFQEQLKQGKGYNYAHNTALMTTFAQSLVEQGFAIESSMGKALAKGIKTRGLKQELEGFVKMGLNAPDFYREAWGTYKKYLASFVGENLEEEAQAQEGAFFNHIRNGVDYELDPHRFGNTAMSMIFSVGGLEAITHMNEKSDVEKWNNGYARALMEPEGAKELIDALESEGAIDKKHADIKRGILSSAKKTFDGIVTDERLTNGNRAELVDLMAERDRWTMASENIEVGPAKAKYAAKASEIQTKIDDLWTKYNDIGEKEGRSNVVEYGTERNYDDIEKDKIEDDGQKSGGNNGDLDGDVSNNQSPESPVQGAQEAAPGANQPNSGQDAGGASTVLDPFEEQKKEYNDRVELIKKNGAPEEEAVKIAWKETKDPDKAAAVALHLKNTKGLNINEALKEAKEIIKKDPNFNPFAEEIQTTPKDVVPYTPRISFYDVMGQDAVVVKDGERGTLKQDDGGKVSVEYDNGKIEELGNIDDLHDKALEDSGLKVENASAVATRTYKVGEDTYISDDLDNAITRDEEGNIKSVTLHKIVDGKPQKTEEFTGQQAENLAYEITLDKFNNLQSNEGIRTIEALVEENAGVVQESDNKGEATTDGQSTEAAKPKEGELDFNAKPEAKPVQKKKKSRKPLWVSQMFPGMRVKDIEKAKKEVDRKQAEEMALELSKEKEAKKLKPVLVTKAKVVTRGGSTTVEVITPDLRDESIEKIKERVKAGQITALHGLALVQEKSRKEGKKNYTDKELNDLAAKEIRDDRADQKEAYNEVKAQPAPKSFGERVKKALAIFDTSNEINVLQTILRGKEKFNLASILEHGSIKKFDSHGEESAEYKALKKTKLVTETGGIKLDQYADQRADAKTLSEIASTVIWAAFAPSAKQAALERLEELDPNKAPVLGDGKVQNAYNFDASSNSGKWNSANDELVSLVQDNRRAFSIYKFLIGDLPSFKEIVDYLNDKGIEIPYTERMKRADETMSANEKQSAIDSYNKSVSDIEGNNAEREKDVLVENNLKDETEYTPNELIDKFPLTGVQKVVWNIIKDIVAKLGIKVKFSSSRITDGFDGSNNPSSGEILIRPSTIKTGRIGEVLVHEVVHALTTKIISRVNSGVTTGLTEKQVSAVKGLMKLYKAVKESNSLENKYPTKDVFEFIAHLTNESFVKELESKDKNFIQKVVDFILDILGINNANELSKKYLKDIIADGVFLQENGITVLPSDYGSGVQGSLTIKDRAQFQIGQESPELKKARTAYETAQKKLSDAQAKITAQQASQPKLFGNKARQGGLFGFNSSEVKSVLDPLKKAVAVAKEAYDKAKTRAEAESNALKGQGSLFQAGDILTPVGIDTFNNLLKNLNKAIKGVFGGVLKGKDFADTVKSKAGVEISTIDGIVYGFVGNDGKIYLNGDHINANTPIHEYGHVWINMIKSARKDIYDKGLELIAKTDYADRVRKNPAYKGLTKTQILEEALAMAIGDRGQFIVGAAPKYKFNEWIKDFWESIKGFFKGKITDLSPDQVSKLSVVEFLDLVAGQLVAGETVVGRDVGFTAKGGNKVVDEKGEPLTVYRSQKDDRSQGNERQSKHFGIYFSQNKESTKIYGDKTKEYHVNLQNPKILKDTEWNLSVIPEYLYNKLKADGYDGAIWMRKGEMYEVVAFDKSQIKEQSLSPLKGAFQITMPDGSKKTVKALPDGVDVVNGFYSPLEKTLAETKLEKLPVKQWLERFGKGEEAKWTGLTDWLNQQQGSVSKSDIQQYLKDNRIQIVEVVKGAEEKQVKYKQLSDMPNAIYGFAERFIETGDKKFLKEIEKEGYTVHYDNNGEVDYLTKEGKTFITDQTKFSEFQLEGQKENYKEVLVTLPKKSFSDWLKENSKTFSEENQKEYESKYGSISNNDRNFKSSHFDEPNILVHLRMNTRTDAEGKKVLFLEEIQSDWGQKGKKEGFKSEEAYKKADEDYGKFLDRMKSKYGRDYDEYYTKEEYNEEYTLLGNRDAAENAKIPSAPFVTDTNAWTKLGLKVALKEAVKQGADKIAWSTGTQQFDRWGSEKIDWKKTDDGWQVSIQEQVSGEAFNNVNVADKALSDITTVRDKERLRSVIKRTLSRERNDAEIDKLTERIWNRMQTEDSGTSLPRKEGMEEFYGVPADMKRAKNFTIKKEGELFAVKDEKGKTIRTFKQENEANKFKENYGLGIVGNIAKSLFKQEPKTVQVEIGKVLDLENSGWQRTPTQEVEAYIKERNGGALERKVFKTVEEAKEWIKTRGEELRNNPKLSTQHSIDITPDLINQVEEGIPLFQIIGRTGAEKLENAAEVMANLEIAKKLKTEGKSDSLIWGLTHWNLGGDGKWKTEIPYGKMSEMVIDKEFERVLTKALGRDGGYSFKERKLSEVFDAPELFKAYPQLKNIPTSIVVDPSRESDGSFTGKRIFVRGRSAEEVRSSIIHEVQHAVQDIEGFGRGSSLLPFYKTDIDVRHWLEAFVEGKVTTEEFLSNPEVEEIMRATEVYDNVKKLVEGKSREDIIKHLKEDDDQAFRQYIRVAGEVESRNASKRANMSKLDLAVKNFAATEEVSEESKIYIEKVLSDNYPEVKEQRSEALNQKVDAVASARERLNNAWDAFKVMGIAHDPWDLSAKQKELYNSAINYMIQLGLEAKQNVEELLKKRYKGIEDKVVNHVARVVALYNNPGLIAETQKALRKDLAGYSDELEQILHLEGLVKLSEDHKLIASALKELAAFTDRAIEKNELTQVPESTKNKGAAATAADFELALYKYATPNTIFRTVEITGGNKDLVDPNILGTSMQDTLLHAETFLRNWYNDYMSKGMTTISFFEAISKYLNANGSKRTAAIPLSTASFVILNDLVKHRPAGSTHAYWNTIYELFNNTQGIAEARSMAGIILAMGTENYMQGENAFRPSFEKMSKFAAEVGGFILDDSDLDESTHEEIKKLGAMTRGMTETRKPVPLTPNARKKIKKEYENITNERLQALKDKIKHCK